MALSLLAVVIGLVVLIWSANKFVDGAIGLAQRLGVSSFLIGMIVVGFGTSAPEIAVSIFAALDKIPEMALGNAYGSNIANIGLILGTTALLCPISILRSAVWRDLLFLILATLLSFIFVWKGDLGRVGASLLLIYFCGVLLIQIFSNFKKRNVTISENTSDEKEENLARSLFWLFLGLLLLMGSSRLLVFGASSFARALGVSDLLVGLTIVAIGTSLPELASSIAAARRGDTALAFGNVVGSNLFNTLIVVGIPALITPMRIEGEILFRDFPVMALFTISLFALSLRKKGEGKIGRMAGALFLLLYFFYLGALIFESL